MIKVVPKIIAVMEVFADAPEAEFAEILNASGLSRSALSHMLDALCACGVLTRMSRGVYRRGVRFQKLRGGPSPSRELSEIAGRAAAALTRLSCALGVSAMRFGSRRITLAKCESKGPFRIEQEDGPRHPAGYYETANGRILLAFAPDAIVAETVRQHGVPPRSCWPEATTLPKLRHELKAIREAEFVAFDVERLIRVMGVPVRDAAGSAVFALSVAYPIFVKRDPDDRVKAVLRETASAFEAELFVRKIVAADLISEMEKKGSMSL